MGRALIICTQFNQSFMYLIRKKNIKINSTTYMPTSSNQDSNDLLLAEGLNFDKPDSERKFYLIMNYINYYKIDINKVKVL